MKRELVYQLLAKNIGSIRMAGFEYCVSAIVYISNNLECKKNIKEIYMSVAKEFGTSESCVERSIRYFKETTTVDIDLGSLIGIALSAKYPNKEFVLNLYDYCRRELLAGSVGGRCD